MKLSIATCYFPVDADIDSNFRHVRAQMLVARRAGADVAHFPEGALSGYAGTDFRSFRGFDWHRLEERTRDVMELARQLKLWVIPGSSHRLTGRHRPHNCVYVIDDRGRIVDRYDKLFCSSLDLQHYSPGDHFTVFTLKGIRCGIQVCYDYAFPELYREYKRREVQLVFHSFHAGHASPDRVRLMESEIGRQFHRLNRGASYPEIRMPASMQAAATASHIWISCSNTSARYSCFPSFFVRADGVVTGRLKRHASGVLVSEVDTVARLYDGPKQWRDRAMRGVFHSGTLVRDRRSRSRREL